MSKWIHVNNLIKIMVFIFFIYSFQAYGKELPEDTLGKHQPDLYMLNYQKFINFGWYCSVNAKAVNFKNGWGAFIGGRAALLVDHVFSIGAGYEISLYTDRKGMEGGASSTDRLNGYASTHGMHPRILYGGPYIAYYILYDQIVNFSLGALAGWGHCGKEYASGSGATFFILEPELYVYVNLPKYARIGIGTSYRLSWGVRYEAIRDEGFRGFSISLQFQAGFL